MLLSGFAAATYEPSWFDPGDPLWCSCSAAEAAAALRSLWVWTGAGAVLALAGTVLFTLRLDPAPRPPAGPLPAPAHAVVAGMVGFVVPPVLFLPALYLLLVSSHLDPLIAFGVGTAIAAAVGGVDRAIGPAWSSRRRSAVTGLVAGALGTGVAWVVLFAEPTVDDGWMPAVAAGAVVALVVLAARTLLAPRGAGTRTGRAAGAAATVGAVALVCIAVLAPEVLLPGPDDAVAAAPAGPAAPTPEPPSSPASSAPVPAPATTTPPPLVEADVACDQADLAFVISGWDAAMGARFASVQATNTGDVACWVEGVPTVTLLQGGRPLQLTLEPGEMGNGSPVVVQQVGIAPGGHAYAQLDWRTYAGWADDTTPQSVTVALTSGTTPVPAGIVGGHGVAPFDLADGGAWGVGPWAPPWS
jgi:hypothetical protein